MKDFWFYSWAIYTSSEAGGQSVFKAGSDIIEAPSEMTPPQVHLNIMKHLKAEHGTFEFHITALNRV